MRQSDLQPSKLGSLLERIGNYFATLNYSYGLRVAIGVGIAWFVAFRLHTDKPYWSIMTVMIVTLPMQSMLVEKFLARLIGTIVGAIVVNLLASIALDDQWLFTIYMAFWLAICSYLASMRGATLSYCFALCGYTSAILGFALSISPSSYMVFQITQARILEILIGLVTAFFVSMLWPSHLERILVKQQLRLQRTSVRKLYQALLTADFDPLKFNKQYEKMLLSLMDFRDLVYQEFLSVSTEREDNQSIYRYTYRLMRAVSGVLSLQSIKQDLLKSDRNAIVTYLSALSEWFTSTGIAEEKLARKPAPPAALLQSSKGREFVAKLEEKFTEFYQTRLDQPIDEDFYMPSRNVHFSDKKEAFINAGRTFVSIILGMAFWMGTQWDMGYILLILIGILCTLGATYPMITKLLSITFGLTLLFTVPISFMLKFGVLIQVTSIVPAMLIILPIYCVAATIRASSILGFLVGYGFLLSSSFLIGFSNPMSFDIEPFGNQVFALLVALGIILLIFHIIRPTSNVGKMERVQQNIMLEFSQLANHVSAKSVKNYEALLSSAVQQAKVIPEIREKSEFLAYCFLTIVFLKEQLKLQEQGVDWQIPENLISAVKEERFKEALMIVSELEKTAPKEEQLTYWVLRCALTSFNEFLELPESMI